MCYLETSARKGVVTLFGRRGTSEEDSNVGMYGVHQMENAIKSGVLPNENRFIIIRESGIKSKIVS